MSLKVEDYRLRCVPDGGVETNSRIESGRVPARDCSSSLAIGPPALQVSLALSLSRSRFKTIVFPGRGSPSRPDYARCVLVPCCTELEVIGHPSRAHSRRTGMVRGRAHYY